MMSKIIDEQLDKLKNYAQTKDGDSIIFHRKNSYNCKKEKAVVFEDYILHPFPGFDLHEKWNNGIAPPERTMYGDILKETTGMYLMSLHTETSGKSWTGWCPKKSCRIKE